MGKFGRAIAAGVHSGLTTLGAGIMQAERDKRVDERLEKEDAFKDRQLAIQERDADLRADAAGRQKIFDDAKINHAKLTKGLAGAGENRVLQAEAITKFFPDKRIYKFNDRRAQEEDAWGVMDISFLDKDPITGEVQLDKLTGLPKEMTTRAPTNEIVFKTQADYESFKAGIVSPELYLAYATQDLSTEQAIRKANAMADWYEGTEKGKREAAKTKAETKLAVERAGQAKRSPAGTGANLSKIKEQGFNQFANNLTKELGVSVSADTAKKIAAISDNPKVRGVFLSGVSKALDPDDPTTRADFIESGVKQGLPREFMDRMYSQAETAYEERGEEKALSDSWFGNMYDKLLGLFSD